MARLLRRASAPTTSEAFHKEVLAHFPSGIIVVFDRDLRCLLAEGGGLADVGLSSELIVGRCLPELFPERADRSTPFFRAALGGDQLSFESEFADRLFLNTVVPLRDAWGDVVGGFLFGQDITYRQRAEANFRGLLEATPDAIVGIGPDGTIALVNTQAERLFGYTQEELLGQSVDVLVPSRHRAIHPAHRASYFEDPRPRPMGAGRQLTAVRKDGSEFPADISLSALDASQGLLVMAAVRDVTDKLEGAAERDRLRARAVREEFGRQLQQSQRLESLGQLAGGIAHDFNNLLGVILNYAAFIGKSVASAAREDPDSALWPVLKDVQQVIRAAEHGAQLTRQLLAFARRDVVQPRVVNLNDVISDVKELLGRTLGEDVLLTTELATDLWPVRADPGQIEQVLVNLGVNSRDAMPDGGTLRIETDNVTLDDAAARAYSPLRPGRHVRLRVIDSGGGMSQEQLEHAFEPFYTSKPKREGTGLGLATVYGIVMQASGHVEAHSELGVGTEFVVLLPVAEAELEVADSPSPSVRGGGETVLVVEDDEAMRGITARMLTENGYLTLTASTGQEALDLASSYDGEVHLLLTDVVMPKMLGTEVASRLQAIRPEARVIYMSGFAQPELASRGALDAGVTLVQKPFTEATLTSTIRQVLDGAKAP